MGSKIWIRYTRYGRTRPKPIPHGQTHIVPTSGKAFSSHNPDSALVLVEALHNYAKEQDYPKATSLSYNLQGIVHDVRGNSNRALKYYEKSLAILEEIGHKQGISASLNNIGQIYKWQGNYTRALEYYEKSLSIKQEIGNKQGIAASLNNIGQIYNEQGNFTHASEYHERALLISEKLGHKQGIANSLNDTTERPTTNKAKYSRALDYYEKSLAILKKEIGNKPAIAVSLNNIGALYMAQDMYNRALEYFEKSLAINQEIGSKEGITLALNKHGPDIR